MEKEIVQLIVFIILISGLVTIFFRLYKKITLWYRFSRAYRKEDAMTDHLVRQGYRLIETQPSYELRILVNGVPKTYSVRPDLVVEKKGVVYAVEIKSGKTAPNPLFESTRRQLMEYYFGLDCDALLLVNAETYEIFQIDFPYFPKKTKTYYHFARYLVIFFLLFILILFCVSFKFYLACCYS